MSGYNCLSCDITVTNPEGDVIRFRSAMEVIIDTSYDTVTDTAKVTLPRDQRFIIPDENGLNTYVLLDADGLQSSGLFQRGDRIEIKLGYDFDDKVVFTGFITGIEAQRPFTLLCEDAAWLLKQKTLNFSAPENTNLTDLVSVLIEGTGVELHTEAFTEIELGKLTIRNATPAKILNDLRSKGIISYIKEGKLMTGYGSLNGSSIVRSSDTEGYTPPTYNLEYDIPTEKLKLNTLDKRSVLIRAQSKLADNRTITMDIAQDPNSRNPELIIVEYEDRSKRPKADQYAEVEEATVQAISENKQKITNPSGYQVRTTTLNDITDINQIYERAKAAWWQQVDTGFDNSSSFTAFGDHNLQPMETVRIIDPSNPEKNGEFIVKSVTKTWGQNGYRLKANIPHKYKNFK